MIFMQESVFLAPESFDDDQLEELARYIDDPDIVFVAGDLSDDLVFEEDEADSILANYGQIRNYLHKKRLSRGYFPQKRPQGGRRKGGGKGKRKGKRGFRRRNYHARPKRGRRSSSS